MAEPQPLDINILPDKYRRRRLGAPVIAGLIVLVLLILGLAPAYVVLGNARDRTSHLQMRLEELEGNLGQTGTTPAQLEEIEQQIAQTRAQIETIQEAVGHIGNPSFRRSACISAPIVALAGGVQVEEIVQETGTCTVRGQADSDDQALSYARAIRSTGHFGNVMVISLSRGEEKVSGVAFTIRMEP